MNEQVQIIRKDGEPEYAVVPYREFERLYEASEMAEDVEAYDRAKATADIITVPGEVVHRLVDGENPVKVWREHRGLKQAELAERLDVSKGYLSQIESGKKDGTVNLYRKISRVLEVSLDELIGWRE
ncbi:MAG: helix-turn-helix domain-containing protein [Bryobacterales bacterium]|nr:helix-turn-helix domain-containing protein [Bryobacterales bacterium]